jgi:hypothetical protein
LAFVDCILLSSRHLIFHMAWNLASTRNPSFNEFVLCDVQSMFRPDFQLEGPWDFVVLFIISPIRTLKVGWLTYSKGFFQPLE